MMEHMNTIESNKHLEISEKFSRASDILTKLQCIIREHATIDSN